MTPASLSGRARRRVPLCPAVAFLLLVMLAVDLVDTSCDPVTTPRGPLDVSVPRASTPGDPCGTVCIPDCFCCAFAITGQVAALASDPGRAENGPMSVEQRPAAGVPPALDHPPSTLL
jgi:hypothetical protein